MINPPTERLIPVELDIRWPAKLFAAALTGLILGLAFLEPRLSDLSWIALVPLVIVIRERDRVSNFVVGALAGLLWFFIACHWLRHVTWPGLACLALLEGAWLGFWTVAAGQLPVWWRLLAFPMIWTVQEMLRSKGLLGFSWNLMGHLADPFLYLAQVWGVYGLSFLIAAANAFVAALLLASTRRLVLERLPAGGGFFLLLPLIWLSVAYLQLKPVPEAEHQIKASLVQGNFPQSLKWLVDPREAKDRYVRLTEELLAEAKPDLVVWPEVAIPAVLSETPGLLAALREQTRHWRTPLLFGILDRDCRENEAGPLYNSAVFLDPFDDHNFAEIASAQQAGQYLRGSAAEVQRSFLLAPVHARLPLEPVRIYDKARLLPFGEFVPFARLIPFVQQFVENQGGGAFSSGQPGRLLETRFGEIGPLICFESTHPGLARRAVLNGASVLVNLTNDAWFLNTAAPWQHALQCRFRAVETGRAVIRAANTGLTAVYLPDGTIRGAVPPWNETTTTAEVPLHTHLTFQARVGDFFGWLCLICLAFTLYLSIWGVDEETFTFEDGPIHPN
jgi:apolipoprotein N-acyltransferase